MCKRRAIQRVRRTWPRSFQRHQARNPARDSRRNVLPLAMAVGLRFALYCLAVLGTACVQSQLIPCGERQCPVTAVCLQTDSDARCVARIDVDACAGLSEGAACEGVLGAGTCGAGVCITASCGNQRVDSDEVCDDGNRVSGDGCRADCGKVEVCGDGILDDNESCDDGNGNQVDTCHACKNVTWAASASVGAPRQAMNEAIPHPGALALDVRGNIFVSELDRHQVQRITPDGTVALVAGSGLVGIGGNQGPATRAELNYPGSLVVDGLGQLFIGDYFGRVVRMVARDGTITTVAGTGRVGFSGDGGAATSADLTTVGGIALGGDGTLYIADTGSHRIRKVDPSGIITTVAGTGTRGFSGDGGAATQARLASPSAVLATDTGDLLFIDAGNRRIRQLNTNGIVTTIAGGGPATATADGLLASASAFERPEALALDSQQRLYIADAGAHNVRRIEFDGTLTTIAGTGEEGVTGNGGLAKSAQLSWPIALVFDRNDNLYIADRDANHIRRVRPDGIIEAFAGDGTSGASIDSVDALPTGLALDAQGQLLFVDSAQPRVYRRNANGQLVTLAGTGEHGFSGDGGPATAARLTFPQTIVASATGAIYVADLGNHRVRKVALDGIITTVAGNGSPGFSGDGGPGGGAQLNSPWGLAVDGQEALYIADTDNHRIRKLTADGTLTTIAGNGAPGFAGDNGQALAARLFEPAGLALDAAHNLYIADKQNHRVRKISANGIISTVVGSGTPGYSGDGGDAKMAQLDTPTHVALDAQGNLLIADAGNNCIRSVTPNGTIMTLAGTGRGGNIGDGALASNAEFSSPESTLRLTDGTLLIADTWNGRIRHVANDGRVTTLLGARGLLGLGATSTVRLDAPSAIALTPIGAFATTGTRGVLVQILGDVVQRVAGRYPHDAATEMLANFRSRDFGDVFGVAYDATTATLFLSETSQHRIWAVHTQGAGIVSADPSTWTIEAIINFDGIAGYADGAAATARLREPTGLFFDDATRTLYIVERGNHTVRAFSPASQHVITVVNAHNRLGFAGDGGRASSALLYQPAAITRCANGDFFIADTGNHRVRRIAGSAVAVPAATETAAALVTPEQLAAATITTVLGDGVAASSGEGTPATAFPVAQPLGAACDLAGNVFVTSTRTVRVLPADDTGLVDGTGPVRTLFGTTQVRDAFPVSEANCLTAVAVQQPQQASTRMQGHATELAIADACSGLLLTLSR